MADKVRPRKEAEEYWIQPADGVRLVQEPPAPEPEVSVEEMTKMAVAITNGARRTPKGFDEAHRLQWERLVKQINEIKARGGVVDLPSEIP